MFVNDIFLIWGEVIMDEEFIYMTCDNKGTRVCESVFYMISRNINYYGGAIYPLFDYDLCLI